MGKTLNKAKAKIKHGMFLYGFSNFLAKYGVSIEPYYWIQEGKLDNSFLNSFRNTYSDHACKFLNIDEIRFLSEATPHANVEGNLRNINSGQKCIGLEIKGEVVSYMFIEFNSVVFNYQTFFLKKDEAYILNLYTFEKYRGKSFASVLRMESHKLLLQQGINKLYLITNCLNKASLKVNEKLKAKNLAIYLYINLFDRFRWNFLIKSNT